MVYIDSIAIGLSLFEMCESVEMQYIQGEYVPVSQLSRSAKLLLGNTSWTTQKLVPSEEFCLQAYFRHIGATTKRAKGARDQRQIAVIRHAMLVNI